MDMNAMSALVTRAKGYGAAWERLTSGEKRRIVGWLDAKSRGQNPKIDLSAREEIFVLGMMSLGMEVMLAMEPSKMASPSQAPSPN